MNLIYLNLLRRIDFLNNLCTYQSISEFIVIDTKLVTKATEKISNEYVTVVVILKIVTRTSAITTHDSLFNMR